MSAPEFSWLEVARRAWAGRRTAGRFAIAAGVAAAVVMAIVPETYRARAVLLPPQNDQGPGLASMLTTAGTAILGGGSANLSSDVFVEILGSRTVADAVIDSLDLIRVYDCGPAGSERARDSARRILRQRSSFVSSINGVVTIEAAQETGLFPKFRPQECRKSAQLSAEIANAYVEALDKVNQEKNTSGAHSSRVYLEGQIQAAREDRRRAASALLAFQAQHGAVALEDQTRITLDAAGELQGEIMSLRAELARVRRGESEASPRVRSLRDQVDALQGQLAEMLGGAGLRPGGNGTAPGFIAMRELPGIILEYGELVREVKAQEMLIELLTQQYYESRLEESRRTPTVQVLDPAVAPVRKSSPKRIATVLLAALLGGFAGLAWTVGREPIAQLRSQSA